MSISFDKEQLALSDPLFNHSLQDLAQFYHSIRFSNNPAEPIFLELRHNGIILITARNHAFHAGIDLQKLLHDFFAPHAAGDR